MLINGVESSALIDTAATIPLIDDDYLDLDLLDEQARNVLGVVRADEVVLR